jgi:hypothetical protein
VPSDQLTDARLSNPFAAAGDRTLGQRFSSLKLRTALLCAAMVACALLGLRLLQGPLSTLVLELWQGALGQRALPAPHVPDLDAGGLRDTMQAAVVAAVLALSLIGQSYGKFGQMGARWALLPPLLVALVFAWLAPPTRGALPLVPGPLERDILQGRAAMAGKRLYDAESSTPMRQYVMAQVALRSGDAAALKAEGAPVLLLADRVAYGAAGANEQAEGLQFDPAVVVALDLALNGEPMTEVGLRRQAEGAGAVRRGALSSGRLLLGGVLLLASLALLKVWNVMRRRVATIAEQMALDEARARAPVSSATAATAPASALPPVRWGFVTRVALLVVSPLLLLKLIGGLLLWGESSGGTIGGRSEPKPERAAALPGEAVHPCWLAGAWTSSRGDSVFRITLTDEGRFTAEPIAAGPHGKGTYRGRWELLPGQRLLWIHDAQPADRSDVNPILEAGNTAFTLREVSGQTTRFNRIGAVPGKRCRG